MHPDQLHLAGLLRSVAVRHVRLLPLLLLLLVLLLAVLPLLLPLLLLTRRRRSCHPLRQAAGMPFTYEADDKTIKSGFEKNPWKPGFVCTPELRAMAGAVSECKDQVNTSDMQDILVPAEWAFTLIFTAEMLLKLIAFGVYQHTGSYWSDVNNKIDGIVVVTSWMGLLPIFQGTANISFIRMIRLLRPLRTMAYLPGMPVLISSCIESLTPLRDVVLFACAIFFIFSILAVQIWADLPFIDCAGEIAGDGGGSFMAAPLLENGVAWPNGTHDRDTLVKSGIEFYCGSRGSISYENIGYTFVAVFQSITLEGWSDIMYKTTDAIEAQNESDECKVKGHCSWGGASATFFLVLILFNGLYVVQLALAVITDAVTRASSLEKMEKDKKEAMLKARIALGKADAAELDAQRKNESKFMQNLRRSKAPEDYPAFVQMCGKLVLNELFGAFIMAVIILNTVCLAVQYHDDSKCDEMFATGADLIIANELRFPANSACMSSSTLDTLDTLNVIFTLFFTWELVVKAVGLGWYDILSDSFNRFDLVIVIVSLVELGISVFGGGGGGFLTVLRAGRLFRIFKLAKNWGSLRRILGTLQRTINTLGPLLVLMLLFMFVCSLLGTQVYGGKFYYPNDLNGGSFPSPAQFGGYDCGSWSDCRIGRHNFDTFKYSFTTVFQVMSGEDWNMVMYEGIGAAKTGGGMFGSFLYFVLLNVVGNYVILNLFLAVLLQGFADQDEEDREIEEEKKEEKRKQLVAKKSMMESMDGGMAASEDEPEKTGVIKAIDGFLNPLQSPKGGLRAKVTWLVQHSYFETFIITVIIMSSASLAIENPQDTADVARTNYETDRAKILRLCDYFFLAVFTIELLLKHFAYGLVRGKDAYWRDTWNWLDGGIVAIGWVGFINTIVDTGTTISPGLMALRTVRCLRPLRAVRRFPAVKVAVVCLLESIPLMLKVGLVSFLFFLIFAILGQQMFGGGFWSCTFEEALGAPLDSSTTATSANAAMRVSQGLESPVYDLKLNAGYAAHAETQAKAGSELEKLSAILAPATTLKTALSVFSPSIRKALAKQTAANQSAVDVAGAGVLDGHTPGMIDVEWEVYCRNSSSIHGGDCTRFECRALGGNWVNNMWHFDNFGNALIVLSEICTTEGWPGVMWPSVDAVAPGMQPKKDANFGVGVAFFILFIIVGAFFIINLFVGAVIDHYMEVQDANDGSPILTEKQEEWIRTRRKLLLVGAGKAPRVPPLGNRGKVYALVTNIKFEYFVGSIIAMNTVCLSANYRKPMPGAPVDDITFYDNFQGVIGVLNTICVVIFFLEMVLKIYGLDWKHYIEDSWNRFDFFLVLISIVDLLPFLPSLGGFASLFRVFRVARFVRLIRGAVGLRRLMATTVSTLPVLANVAMLLALIYFIFAIVGVNLFYKECRTFTQPTFDNCWKSPVCTTVGTTGFMKGDACTPEVCRFQNSEFDGDACDNLDNRANFKDFPTAMLTLVRLSTGEFWNGIMHDFMAQGNEHALAYFMAFLFLCQFIMMNLLIGVMIASYLDSTEDGSIQADDVSAFNKMWKEMTEEAKAVLTKALDQADESERREIEERIEETKKGWIDTKFLPKLMQGLEMPLGINRTTDDPKLQRVPLVVARIAVNRTLMLLAADQKQKQKPEKGGADGDETTAVEPKGFVDKLFACLNPPKQEEEEEQREHKQQMHMSTALFALAWRQQEIEDIPNFGEEKKLGNQDNKTLSTIEAKEQEEAAAADLDQEDLNSFDSFQDRFTAFKAAGDFSLLKARLCPPDGKYFKEGWEI